MGLVSWIFFGLLAGAVARLIVPGAQRIGCLAATAVGVLGALVGGFLGEAVLDRDVDVASTSARSCSRSQAPSCCCS